ncbi:MAG: hypothetical protein SF123_04385 [Chloroflexota bacterium]|nr:hypothetical protein [Chloroflexota bacterium]
MADYIQDAEHIYDILIDDDGSLNLSADLLQQVGLYPGEIVRLKIVNGQLQLQRWQPVVSQIAAEISDMMLQEGITLDDLLAGLEESGEEVFRETYGDVPTR